MATHSTILAWEIPWTEMTEELILSYPLFMLSIKKSSVWRKDCTEASSGSWAVIFWCYIIFPVLFSMSLPMFI